MGVSTVDRTSEELMPDFWHWGRIIYVEENRPQDAGRTAGPGLKGSWF